MISRKNKKKFSNIKNKKRIRNRSKSRRRKYKGGLTIPPLLPPLPPLPPPPPPRPRSPVNTTVTLNIQKVTINGKPYVFVKNTGFVYEYSEGELIGNPIGKLEKKGNKYKFIAI